MAPPRGKSPARITPKRPARPVLESLSLFDVALEDDSLLMQRSLDGVCLLESVQKEMKESFTMGSIHQEETKDTRTMELPTSDQSEPKENVTMQLSEIQENCEHGHNLDGAAKKDLQSPVKTEEPVLRRKKKKTGANLRKSLAWNNAFFTEEGVLDSEELSLVNRTFKKPADFPKPDFNQAKATANSKLRKPMMIPRVDLSSLSLHAPVVSKGSPRMSSASSSGSGSVLCSPRSSTASIKEITGKCLSGSLSPRLDPNSIKQGKPNVSFHGGLHESKPPLSKRVIDNDTKQNVMPNLPGKKWRDDASSSTVQDACSSGSLNNRERQGRPIHTEASVRLLGGRSAVSNSVEYATRNGASRVVSTSSNVEVKRRVDMLNCPKQSLQKILAKPQDSNEACSTHLDKVKLVQNSMPSSMVHIQSSSRPPTLLNSSKPSGLRMPSPKLGFFEASRAVRNSQGGVLRDKSTGVENNGAIMEGLTSNVVQNSTMKPSNIVNPDPRLKGRAGFMASGIPVSSCRWSAGIASKKVEEKISNMNGKSAIGQQASCEQENAIPVQCQLSKDL